MAEIQQGRGRGQGQGQGQGTENPTASGRYSNTVPNPSARVRHYTGANIVSLNLPSNWREFSSQSGVQFAPEGGYGDQGITHGAMLGVYANQSTDLRSSSEAYMNETLQGNSYLRLRGNLVNINIGGRRGYAAQASGRSPVTGRDETIAMYTTQLRNGQLFYVVTVVPTQQGYNYDAAFRNMLSSIRFYD